MLIEILHVPLFVSLLCSFSFIVFLLVESVPPSSKVQVLLCKALRVLANSGNFSSFCLDRVRFPRVFAHDACLRPYDPGLCCVVVVIFRCFILAFV